jgi:predicted transcriptional regulator
MAHMPELADTTVMTTLRRLADKRLLGAEQLPCQRAHAYRSAMESGAFLAEGRTVRRMRWSTATAMRHWRTSPHGLTA